MLYNKRGSQPAERPLETDEDLRKIRSAYWTTRTHNQDVYFTRYELTHANTPRLVKVPLSRICHGKLLRNKIKWEKRRRGEGATRLDRLARAKLVDLENSSLEASPLLRH